MDTAEVPQEGRSRPTTKDTRRAYEAPRVIVKRSVANATLSSAVGPPSSGLTASG
jgi:hypothetical protein